MSPGWTIPVLPPFPRGRVKWKCGGDSPVAFVVGGSLFFTPELVGLEKVPDSKVRSMSAHTL